MAVRNSRIVSPAPSIQTIVPFHRLESWHFTVVATRMHLPSLEMRCLCSKLHASPQEVQSRCVRFSSFTCRRLARRSS